MRPTGVTARGTILLALGVTLFTASPSRSLAQDPANARPPVAGLGSVHTIIGITLPDEHARFAPLYADLQTDVEARLRRADVRVDPTFLDRFLVVVDIFGEDDGHACLATVDVKLRQFSLPPRSLPRADAPPESTHRVVWALCTDLARQVRAHTRDLVDQFITAYRAQPLTP